MKSDTVHIGVDVSKETLDVYVPPQGGGRAGTKQLDNSVAGFRTLYRARRVETQNQDCKKINKARAS